MEEWLILTINYESEEPDGFPSVKYELTKTFEFVNLPWVQDSWIILHNDAVAGFRFHNISYDPERNTYYVRNNSAEGVERYHHHGTVEEIMKKVVERYKRHEWTVKKLKE